MGAAPGPDLRQDVPAHLRGLPRAGQPPAGRGVQAALRAPRGDGRHTVEPAPTAPQAARGAPDRPRRRGRARHRHPARGAVPARRLGRRRRSARDPRGGRDRDAGEDPVAGQEEEAGRAGEADARQHRRHGPGLRLHGGLARPGDRGQGDARGRPTDAHVPRAALQGHLRHGGGADPPERQELPGGHEQGPGRLRAALGPPSPADHERPGRLHVSARAGIVVTGTEVLSGIIPDRNGPWLAERLRERGVQLAHVMIVGDRPQDLRAALDFLAGEGMDVIVTSGGLGPTADDLTADVVAGFAGREMRLDEALEGRIAAILERLRSRWVGTLDEDAMRAGTRKQAMVPEGATVLEPVGTAPGLVVPADGVTVVVLPGPPGELQRMWDPALETEALRAALSGAGEYEQRILRLFGPPESEIALTLREAEHDGVPLERLEITTCLRRGEIEIA